MHHLYQAFRKLNQAPGFALLSIFTLAIGIAATTAIFSVVNGVLLKPLPHPEPEELVYVTHSAPGLNLEQLGLSNALYFHYRENAETFLSLALFDRELISLTGSGTPERLQALTTTASFFEVLKTPPALGRAFVEEEERPGSAPVVILSDGLWQRRFGADPNLLGTQIELNGVAREVIGVMPAGFDFMRPDVELYLPLELDPAQASLGSFGVRGVARLAPGATVERATADLSRLVLGLEEAFPQGGTAGILLKAGFSAFVRPLRDEVVGDVEAILWVLLGAVGVVLLIAGANVANLFLVRAEERQRDTAIRTALGARRWQLIGSAMTESLLLSLAAGAAGLTAAAFALRWLIRLGPRELPRLQEISIDGRVLSVAAAASLFAGIVFGLIPGWYGRLRELAGMLKDGGRSATAGRDRHRARHALVGAQVALALVLLISSGLMVRSFWQLSNVDPGFRSENVLTADLWLTESDYPSDEAVAGFYQRLLDRVRAVPGIVSAGALSPLPLSNTYSVNGYMLEDFPLDPGDLPPVFGFTYATPEALETLGVRLLEGRFLTSHDQESRSGAVLISETVARKYWPQESALGKRLGTSTPDAENPDPWLTVVGVVSDVHTIALQQEPPEMIYLPLVGKEAGDWTARGLTLVLHTGGPVEGLAESVRRAIWELDAELPIARVRPLDEVVSQHKAPMALTMVMFLIAGAVSLTLGLVGTFGIISYLVSQRTSEIGVRMALGARQSHIRGMVLRQGLTLAGAGAVLGVALAFFVTRWLESLLFEIRPLDAPTFLAVPVALLLVAMLASWLPAQRAARIEPVVALRHE